MKNTATCVLNTDIYTGWLVQLIFKQGQHSEQTGFRSVLVLQKLWTHGSNSEWYRTLFSITLNPCFSLLESRIISRPEARQDNIFRSSMAISALQMYERKFHWTKNITSMQVLPRVIIYASHYSHYSECIGTTFITNATNISNMSRSLKQIVKDCHNINRFMIIALEYFYVLICCNYWMLLWPLPTLLWMFTRCLKVRQCG